MLWTQPAGRALGVAALVATGALACSSSPFNAGDESLAVPELCNGTTEPRLLTQTLGSGAVEPGSEVLSENGFDFLVVTGDCRYWTQKEAGGDVRTGLLTEAQAEDWAQRLGLARWPHYEGNYQLTQLSHPPILLHRFSETRVTVNWGDSSGARSAVGVEWMRQALREAIETLHGSGSPADGPVRLKLLRVDAELVQVPPHSSAVAWPLSTPADGLAVTIADSQANEQGTSHLISTPTDAAALRELVRSHYANHPGASLGAGVPVVDAAGAHFQLFIRDVIPLEDEKGLWRVAAP